MKFKQKKERKTAPNSMAPLQGLEPRTYCSASKRSNPLSYKGRQCSILSQLDMTVKDGVHPTFFDEYPALLPQLTAEAR